MRNVFSIWRREILSFFVSPIAYFLLAGFLLLAGYFFFNLLGAFNMWVMRFNAMRQYQGMAEGPNLNQWVIEPFYHTLLVILVFLIPIVTMRTLAEERKKGTFELLITSPLSVAEIIYGKFLGVAFVVSLMVASVFAFPLLLIIYGEPGPEVGPILSGFLAVLLCGLAFSSISMAVSAFTENQVVAAVSSMVTMLLLYVIHSPAESAGGVLSTVLEYLSPVTQSREMIRGVMSLQSFVYYISLIWLGIFLSQRALDAQRWR